MLILYDIYNDSIMSNDINISNIINNKKIIENYDVNMAYKNITDNLYKKGILENIIIHNNNSNRNRNKSYNLDLENYNNLNNDWLLGYYISNYLDNIFNNSCNILLLGSTDINLIKGIYHWYKNANIYININWNVYTTKTKNNNRIIKNINEDYFSIENIINNKLTIKKKGKVNIIFNKNNPLNFNNLLLSIINSINLLKNNGICISKIMAPFLWDEAYYTYLELYSIFFYNVKILKFPVCKNKKYFYNYYLLAFDKKKIVNKKKIFNKLLILLKNNKNKKINFNKNNEISIKIDWLKEVNDINVDYIYELLDNLY